MTRFKTILTISAMSIIGALSRANAQTCPDSITYFETPNHCKLIDNQSRLVINYRDTVPIYGIKTITKGCQQKIICDIGGGRRLIYDRDYYKRRNWIPPHHTNDITVFDYSLKDICLVDYYYYFDDIGDFSRRDSTENLILQNRCRTLEYIKNARQNGK